MTRDAERFSTGDIEYGFAIEAKGVTPPLFKQVHGSDIVEISSLEARGKAAQSPREADGAWSRDAGVPLHVFTADCVPLLFFGPANDDPIAAVHCGWRGAKLGIGRRAVETLGPLASALHVVLGPAILSCCFEVKHDFVDEFAASGRDITPYLEQREGRLFCDLVRFVREEELRGLPPDHVHLGALRCTVCSTPRLPSYRRDRGTDPRIRSWIARR